MTQTSMGSNFKLAFSPVTGIKRVLEIQILITPDISYLRHTYLLLRTTPVLASVSMFL